MEQEIQRLSILDPKKDYLISENNHLIYFIKNLLRQFIEKFLRSNFNLLSKVVKVEFINYSV